MTKELRDAVKFLNETNIALCEDHEDGRYNSTIDEDTIITLLEEKYGEENIEEDLQGRDFLTFECPACKTTQKSHRIS